jgi:Protein of unknown function DUF262
MDGPAGADLGSAHSPDSLDHSILRMKSFHYRQKRLSHKGILQMHRRELQVSQLGVGARTYDLRCRWNTDALPTWSGYVGILDRSDFPRDGIMAKAPIPAIGEPQQDIADAQIREKQREVKYDLRDFTIDYIIKQFREGLFYVPDYQREYVWPDGHRCRFIESVILGLPIPMMFVADMEDGRLEIVDGAQRIQTLESFETGDLRLEKLTQLTTLDGFRFSDLPLAQQRKFGTRALRLVVLEDSTTLEVRQEIFNRINTSAFKARSAEVRRGAYSGPLMTLVKECASNPLFLRLCPMTKSLIDRREGEELVLRFFAYSDRYSRFKHDVEKFLDSYVLDEQATFDVLKHKQEFLAVLDFVDKHFPAGFAKSRGAKTTPRVRFEAIAVGTNLALRRVPDLRPQPVDWLDSSDFQSHVTTHASNSLPRLRGRVEYVRDQLLRD